MKILLVNEGGLERAGVCLFMYQWVQAFFDAFPGNTVTVYFRLKIKDSVLKEAFEAAGARIIAGNHSIEETTADKSNRDAVKRDLQAILRDRYDVVHINSSVIGFTTLALSEAVRAKVPVRISHCHGKFDESILKKFAHDLLRSYIRKNATLYAGCSNPAGIYMFGKKGILSPKWHKVPNTIQAELFRFDESQRRCRRNEIGIDENEILLGAVGYLEEVKNHTFLVNVLDRLKKKGVSVKLIILGDGSLKKELSLKIKRFGLDKDIILYGKSDNIPGWLSAMDYYLMPSLSEGFPLSAVEAQASGLKCLLSDRISTEVDITSNVYHLSIDNGPETWVKIIEEVSPSNSVERILAADQIAGAGYDISALQNEIIKMYGLRIEG